MGSWVSYFGPLGLVLMFTMGKELNDDYKRGVKDKEANSTEYDVINPEGVLTTEPSSNLKVGDIIFVKKNQRIPADLILLHSSNKEGTVFIRTD